MHDVSVHVYNDYGFIMQECNAADGTFNLEQQTIMNKKTERISQQGTA